MTKEKPAQTIKDLKCSGCKTRLILNVGKMTLEIRRVVVECRN